MHYDCFIIDDEKLLADSTAEYFNLFGVKTAVAYSAAECRKFFLEHTAELLLLDINLGDESGFHLCRTLSEQTNIPIMFISARTSDDDKLIALNIGGDDYIQKPYSLSVLLAKVKVVLKRYGQGREEMYSDGWLGVDFCAREVMVNGRAVKLTSLEYKLLLRRLKKSLEIRNMCLPSGETDISLSGEKDEVTEIILGFSDRSFDGACSSFCFCGRKGS